MKVIQTIKKVLTGIVAIVFFTFVIAVTLLLLNYNKYGVTQFGDTSFILIKGDLSSEKYAKGDLVLVESRKIDKIAVGDEIFTYKIASDGAVSIDLGVVGETHVDDNAISFENGSAYSMDFVIGEASKVYSKLGSYLSVIESKWGFLFIVLVPSFLIFVYEFYALVIELKYGKEEQLV
jgi:hypothetical protein